MNLLTFPSLPPKSATLECAVPFSLSCPKAATAEVLAFQGVLQALRDTTPWTP